ncbi:MAG: sigma-70 family RNA polymerase sigma factor [Ruminococcus sp.]|nr:sigma-70 family RNA polymerase sigma factor [Ruminococcus sp.]
MKDNIALYAFRLYGDTVLRAAYAACGSYQEAEDITQDVFLTLHAKPQEFNDDEHLKAWLLRVTINKCRNLRKSFRMSRTQPLDEIPEQAAPGDDIAARELRAQIASLPQKYAEVIYLYYYEGYNLREIAGMTGRSENTVSSLLQRGRRKLKMEIEREDAYETQ